MLRRRGHHRPVPLVEIGEGLTVSADFINRGRKQRILKLLNLEDTVSQQCAPS